MKRHYSTVAIPFDAAQLKKVERELASVGNPANGTLSKRLDAFGRIHFVSMSILPDEREPRLLLESSTDGADVPPLAWIAKALEPELTRILAAMNRVVSGWEAAARELEDHELTVERHWAGQSGLVHTGAIDMDVERIRNEERLGSWLRQWFATNPREGTSLATLERARAAAFQTVAFKWALNCEPAPMLELAGKWGRLQLFASIVWGGLWRSLVIAAAYAAIYAVVIGYLAAPSAAMLFVWMPLFTVSVVASWGLLKLRLVRRQEQTELPADIEPNAGAVSSLLERENEPGHAQNHLTGVTTLKPGRRAIVRLALWAIARAIRYRSKPGGLNGITTIHVARWMLLPGTDKLLFFANYDGSWGSYLDDFTTFILNGVNLIWGNTFDYPRTNFIVKDGARDGTRFRRWARRHTLPTAFWYSAYPQLTLDRIRANAALRHAFAGATTERQAAEWLKQLGVHAEHHGLDVPEIPTLIFGGLSKLPFAHTLIVSMSDDVRACRQWLAELAPAVTYGGRLPDSKALVVGFSASGIVKLGVDARTSAQFPTAFQHGMSAAGRARILGDDPHQPWEWGRGEDAADAILMLYAKDGDVLKRLVRRHRRRAEVIYGHRVVAQISSPALPQSGPIREPFGSIDGISQPVIRGTRAARRAADIHRVEAGELVLGYSDNVGSVAPPIRYGDVDIARNGTFLVVRQLEQNVAAFKRYVEEEAARVGRTPEWVTAKMVGRWPQDGSSIVRHPNAPASVSAAASVPDNDFLFGKEDPHGVRCPFGAHIRRANPRESVEPGSKARLELTNQRRILRVGRRYVVCKDEKREPESVGVLFMCLNTDIEEQFEFVQQMWVQGSQFHGLRDEVDPVVGPGNDRTMTIPTPNGPMQLCKLQQFVTTRGGEYFFMPSRRAVTALYAEELAAPVCEKCEAEAAAEPAAEAEALVCTCAARN